MDSILASCTGFEGPSRFAAGSYLDVALAARALLARTPSAALLIFDNRTGKQIDFDLRGTETEIAARLTTSTGLAASTGAPPAVESDAAPASRAGPGRPRLGVVAREVTLLPRHWDWLAAQRGGASVALRRLVEAARLSSGGRDRARNAAERAYHFMSAIAGDLPGFEEASRALFAGDRRKLGDCIAAWPADISDHALALAAVEEASPAAA